jgi:methyl-accepting chemotaxis protein
MNLGTRILLGYGFLITVLVLTAAGAALGFHQLGRGIEMVMAENFKSVSAATQMLEALERQDSASLSLVLGKKEAEEDLDAQRKRFNRELAKAEANITMDGEGAIVADVARLFSSYSAALDTLIASGSSATLAAYDTRTLPRFMAVKDAVLRLLAVNHQAMLDADMSARRFALRGSIVLGFVVAGTLLSFGFLSRLLNRDLLLRLTDMNNAVKDVAAGDLGRRFDPVQNDELGSLARQLNAALDARSEADGRMRGMLSQQRQLLFAMLEQWGRGAALIGLDGLLIASTLTDERNRVIADSREAIREKARAAIRKAPADLQKTMLHIVTDSGETLSLNPLVAGRQRPVGWIVTFPDQD